MKTEKKKAHPSMRLNGSLAAAPPPRHELLATPEEPDTMQPISFGDRILTKR